MTKARRPNLYVITALKRKYGQLKGQPFDLLADRDQISADMAHVAAVLAMFDPTVDLRAIRAIRPYKHNRGRWSRAALEILRRSNRPLKAFELARLVMARLEIEPDRRTVMSIGYSLQAVLARLQAQGLVTATGKPRRWSVGRT